MKKKFLVPAIGIGAFIIGGIVARTKALDVVETLEHTFTKKPSTPAEK